MPLAAEISSTLPVPAARKGRRRRAVLAIAALAFVAWQSYVFFVAEYGLVENPPVWGSTYWVGEVSGERTAIQDFVAEATTVDSVTIHARPAGPSESGTVLFELWEDSSEGRGLIWRTTRDLSEVVAESTYVLRFPPLVDALRRKWVYSIRVSVPDARPGEGIYLLANHGDTYPDGPSSLARPRAVGRPGVSDRKRSRRHLPECVLDPPRRPEGVSFSLVGGRGLLHLPRTGARLPLRYDRRSRTRDPTPATSTGDALD